MWEDEVFSGPDYEMNEFNIFNYYCQGRSLALIGRAKKGPFVLRSDVLKKMKGLRFDLR